MAAEAFEEFLKKKKEQDRTVDWEDRKNKWTKSVTDFYNNVHKWLYPFTEKALLKIKVKEIMVSEEYIGTYKLNQLDIFLGNDIISLIPRGTLILGSYGRIDMKGPKGDRLIIEQKWGEWKFVTKVNRRELWDVNNESFESAIQDLVNG
jgi:hypothetical protein